MTHDLDTLLSAADPARHDEPDDTLLARLRERVDRERADITPIGHRRSPWPRRLTLIAAVAAVLTAVPLVLSAVTDDDDAPSPLLPAAVAANGEITCAGTGFTTAVRPADSPVRLLPDQLPAGWSYTRIMVRRDATTGECIPPSLTALREDAEGLVTGRISVTGPVEARLDERKLAVASVPDQIFGHEARRIDLQPFDVAFHRWFFTDAQGERWSVEASGMPLEEARQELAAVSIDGSDVAWDGALAPGWTLVHLREGAPYRIAGQLTWMVELTDGSTGRLLQVFRGAEVPLLAGTGVGEQVITVGGRPAVLGQVRVNEAPPGTETDTPSGSVSRPVLVEVAPGTVAFGFSLGDDLPQVEQMLASLQQVAPDDPRLERYGED